MELIPCKLNLMRQKKKFQETHTAAKHAEFQNIALKQQLRKFKQNNQQHRPRVGRFTTDPTEQDLLIQLFRARQMGTFFMVAARWRYARALKSYSYTFHISVFTNSEFLKLKPISNECARGAVTGV